MLRYSSLDISHLPEGSREIFTSGAPRVGARRSRGRHTLCVGVGPTGAYFTRACEICGLAVVSGKPNEFVVVVQFESCSGGL